MSSPCKKIKLSNHKDHMREMRACLSPMADNNLSFSQFTESPITSEKNVSSEEDIWLDVCIL